MQILLKQDSGANLPMDLGLIEGEPHYILCLNDKAANAGTLH